MTAASTRSVPRTGDNHFINWGVFWLLVAIVGAGVFFQDGIEALFQAWQLPEYSHGPIIPILSAFLLLKQLRDYPINPDVPRNRWPGVLLVLFSIAIGLLGSLAGIGDIVAYALIFWVGGVLLISWGWTTGKHFWPGVVHLVYMLPLPGVIYYKTTTYLQFTSSELGVVFLRLMDIPVFLDGNIIDLGVLKLHVAEACSGLTYVFPIMSFSYVFAALYRGPIWHKAFLLLAAVPIAILMNAVRIALAGIIVQNYGVEWLSGFTHFFEGWVIFLACILILFALAWLLLFLNPQRLTLTDALDLEMTGLGTQLARIQFVQPSKELIGSSILMLSVLVVMHIVPERGGPTLNRDSFAVFPRSLGNWQQDGPAQFLERSVAETLGADDYHQIMLSKAGEKHSVGLFMAWYDDQSKGGVHSPEICLPGAGWEIAWLERTNIGETMATETDFKINRAIIQKGEVQMLAYYWFQQKNRRIAWDFAAKYWLLVDGIMTGRTDGALVRLTTLIDPSEDEAVAEARLLDVLHELEHPISRFIPSGQ